MGKGTKIRTAVVLAIAAGAAALNACSPSERKAQTRENHDALEAEALTLTAHELVLAELKDPGSAVFKYDLPRRSGLFCGTVLARNSFGGYGDEIFYIMFPFGVVNSEVESQSRFKRLWDLYCVDHGSPTIAPASRNRFNDLILRAKNIDRAWILGRLVGNGCLGRTAYFMGSGNTKASKDIAFWSARCSNGQSYEVGIWPDRSARVLECSILRRLHAGKCFQKL